MSLDLEAGGVEHAPVARGVGVEPLAVAAAAVEAEEGRPRPKTRQPELDLLGREEHAVGHRAHGLEGADRVAQVEQQAAAHHDVERADLGGVEVVDAQRPPVDLRARELGGQPEARRPSAGRRSPGRGPAPRPGSRAASPRAGGPRRRWRRPRRPRAARARRRGTRRRCRCRGSACPARWATAAGRRSGAGRTSPWSPRPAATSIEWYQNGWASTRACISRADGVTSALIFETLPGSDHKPEAGARAPSSLTVSRPCGSPSPTRSAGPRCGVARSASSRSWARRSSAGATRSRSCRSGWDADDHVDRRRAHRAAAATPRGRLGPRGRLRPPGAALTSLRGRFDAVHSMGRRDAVASIRAARLPPRRRTSSPTSGCRAGRSGRRTAQARRGVVERVVARHRRLQLHVAVRPRLPRPRLRPHRRRGRARRGGPRRVRARRPARSRVPTLLLSGAYHEPRKGVGHRAGGAPAHRRATSPRCSCGCRAPATRRRYLAAATDEARARAPWSRRRRQRTSSTSATAGHGRRCCRRPTTASAWRSIESLACGTPIVVSTHGAPHELVDERRHRRAVRAARRCRAWPQPAVRAFALARQRPTTVDACRASAARVRLGPRRSPRSARRLYAGVNGRSRRRLRPVGGSAAAAGPRDRGGVDRQRRASMAPRRGGARPRRGRAPRRQPAEAREQHAAAVLTSAAPAQLAPRPRSLSRSSRRSPPTSAGARRRPTPARRRRCRRGARRRRRRATMRQPAACSRQHSSRSSAYMNQRSEYGGAPPSASRRITCTAPMAQSTGPDSVVGATPPRGASAGRSRPRWSGAGVKHTTAAERHGREAVGGVLRPPSGCARRGATIPTSGRSSQRATSAASEPGRRLGVGVERDQHRRPSVPASAWFIARA